LHPERFLSRLARKEELSPGIYRIDIEAPALVKKASPGRFVMLRVHEGLEPLLRRPFSICGTGNDTVELLFQVRGKGTEMMSTWHPGRVLDLVGPLGNGFRLPEKMQEALLVAGGIGIAPLLFLARKLIAERKKTSVKIFFGGKTAADVSFVEKYNLQGIDFYYATEDGSKGFAGMVTELFLDYVKQGSGKPGERSCTFGCGPPAMAKALAGIAAQTEIPCQISLESRMACGTGACMGCALRTADGSTSHMYKRVCADGPVFEMNEVDWDALGGP